MVDRSLHGTGTTARISTTQKRMPPRLRYNGWASYQLLDRLVSIRGSTQERPGEKRFGSISSWQLQNIFYLYYDMKGWELTLDGGRTGYQHMSGRKERWSIWIYSLFCNTPSVTYRIYDYCPEISSFFCFHWRGRGVLLSLGLSVPLARAMLERRFCRDIDYVWFGCFLAFPGTRSWLFHFVSFLLYLLLLDATICFSSSFTFYFFESAKALN